MSHAKKWQELTEREKEQVQLMLFSLKEFSYGFERADNIAEEVPSGSASFRFYMNSLYQYCSSYFLVGGAHKLTNALKALGSSDLLQPIEEILAKPLGSTTFGDIIRTFRNKFLTHQSFTFGPTETRVHKKFDLSQEENAQLFSCLVNDLYAHTQHLYVQLAQRYPEAMGI